MPDVENPKNNRSQIWDFEPRISKILRSFLTIFSVFGIVQVIIVAISRMFYPFELEWIEGLTVELVNRIIEGKSIYCPPSIEYIPMVYTPLYHYLGALVSKISGVGFAPLRALSLVSFLFSLFILFKIIFEITKDKFWSLVGIGLFSLSFAFCGFWFDLARIDTFANFMLILSFYFLLQKNASSIFFAAFSSFFAFYSKQSNFIVTIFLLIPLFFESKQRFLIFILYYIGLALVSTLAENYFTNGWYLFWNFLSPMAHQLEWSRLITFWTTDLIPSYPIFFVLIGLFLIGHFDLKECPKSEYYLYFLVGTFLNSYIFRLNYGGFLNVFIPLATSIAILFPVFLGQFVKRLNASNNSQNLAYVFVLVQFIVLFYNPFLQIPKKLDEKVGWEFISKIKNLGSEVFIPGHSYISRYGGKKSFAHYVRINEFLSNKGKERDGFYRELIASLSGHRFSAIILDSDISIPEIEKYYYKSGQIIKGKAFYTVVGKSRPQEIWLPKNE